MMKITKLIMFFLLLSSIIPVSVYAQQDETVRVTFRAFGYDGTSLRNVRMLIFGAVVSRTIMANDEAELPVGTYRIETYWNTLLANVTTIKISENTLVVDILVRNYLQTSGFTVRSKWGVIVSANFMATEGRFTIDIIGLNTTLLVTMPPTTYPMDFFRVIGGNVINWNPITRTATITTLGDSTVVIEPPPGKILSFTPAEQVKVFDAGAQNLVDIFRYELIEKNPPLYQVYFFNDEEYLKVQLEEQYRVFDNPNGIYSIMLGLFVGERALVSVMEKRISLETRIEPFVPDQEFVQGIPGKAFSYKIASGVEQYLQVALDNIPFAVFRWVMASVGNSTLPQVEIYDITGGLRTRENMIRERQEVSWGGAFGIIVSPTVMDNEYIIWNVQSDRTITVTEFSDFVAENLELKPERKQYYASAFMGKDQIVIRFTAPVGLTEPRVRISPEPDPNYEVVENIKPGEESTISFFPNQYPSDYQIQVTGLTRMARWSGTAKVHVDVVLLESPTTLASVFGVIIIAMLLYMLFTRKGRVFSVASALHEGLEG